MKQNLFRLPEDKPEYQAEQKAKKIIIKCGIKGPHGGCALLVKEVGNTHTNKR